MDVNGTAALVTGAASGLGAETAAALARAGATVFGLDLPNAIEKIEEPNAAITFLAADVTDPDQVAAAIVEIEAAGVPLRVVVNCAGIGPSQRVLSRKGPHDLDLFATVLRINLLGTFNVLRLAADVMARTETVDALGQRGVIVNTASVAAFEGQIGQIAYAASKGGVHSMTVPAARDLAQFGIRVNTIAPGIVDTPMLATVGPEFRAALSESVPFPKRLATADEFAGLVLAIIGQDYLNGETIRLDGALRMAPR
ncbi:SDR family NAD(P)-dependent oxidoreductase [Nocardia sp. alder85J]|uniref:SDR family NAD(P)-dependent oxidoreductase n=1 Tax=Nocardia sp. alder85J TaxID=2862949 RepID=UPI001CD26915|nr:SDR family NAD(P)-dependent oxidoreductase [Nocardia sp. alder85J]MCX4095632.1 SDR family NAD(P)-dependent oxidoreductase [Nocardia sp. alder85J]